MYLCDGALKRIPVPFPNSNQCSGGSWYPNEWSVIIMFDVNKMCLVKGNINFLVVVVVAAVVVGLIVGLVVMTVVTAIMALTVEELERQKSGQ